jgi:hypothetical protein
LSYFGHTIYIKHFDLVYPKNDLSILERSAEKALGVQACTGAKKTDPLFTARRRYTGDYSGQ